MNTSGCRSSSSYNHVVPDRGAPAMMKVGPCLGMFWRANVRVDRIRPNVTIQGLAALWHTIPTRVTLVDLPSRGTYVRQRFSSTLSVSARVWLRCGQATRTIRQNSRRYALFPPVLWVTGRSTVSTHENPVSRTPLYVLPQLRDGAAPACRARSLSSSRGGAQ